MMDAKPVFFDSKKFIGNPMYVLSPLHLPQDAICDAQFKL
jgi:hypothetical protein